MTKLTLAEQTARRTNAINYLTCFRNEPIQNVLGKHFQLKTDDNRQFVPYLPIQIESNEDGTLKNTARSGARSNLTLEQLQNVKFNGSCSITKADGTEFTYYPKKSAEATHYEVRLNFGKPKIIIDIDGLLNSGDITVKEYFESDVPNEIRNAPFFLSRTKSLPHHIFYIEDLPADIKPDKYINVFKGFNGDILLNHVWEMKDARVYNYNGDIPTIKWEQIVNLLNPEAQAVKDHLIKSNAFTKMTSVKAENKVIKQIKKPVIESDDESDSEVETETETYIDYNKKIETIKTCVNDILNIKPTFFDEYDKWCLLGFICFNETNGDETGEKCYIELSKKFKTDSGKKHDEKAVKKQYYATQKSRDKKLGVGSLILWLSKMKKENDILEKKLKRETEILEKKNQKEANKDFTIAEAMKCERYLSFKEKFETNYFKLMTPMRFVRIINDKKGKLLHFYSQKEFLDLTRDEKDMPVFIVRIGAFDVPKRFTDIWLDDENKLKYSRIKFDPVNLEHDEDYNMFAGFVNRKPNVPVMGQEEFAKTGLGKLFDWLFEDEQIKEYIKCWFAHILKQPHIKTKVAIVLFSTTHGAGKNTIVDYFIKIIGHLLCGQVETIEDITKNFNSHLCNRLLIYGDEITANAKKVADRLKQVITRPTQNLEKKGVDAIEVNDFTNWIFTTNNENCFKIEEGDRRLCMVRCREKRQIDISEACYNEMEDATILSKMFAYFYNYEQTEESIKKFGKFNIGKDKAIDTQYKNELLLENKPAYIQALYKEPELFINKKMKATEMFALTQQYAKKHFLSSNYTSTEFGLKIKAFFNEENKCKCRGNAGIYYQFPSRTNFLKILYQTDETYYRYINQLPDDFTPEFKPPTEEIVTSWNGKEYTTEVDEPF